MREIKKLLLLLVLVFSLSSCGDNYYDDVVDLPRTNVELRIDSVKPDAFAVEFKFKNIYNEPIERLYVTYYVVDSFNRILVDFWNQQSLQTVVFTDSIDPGEEVIYTMPRLFYNPFAYRAKVYRLSAKFQE